MLSRSVLLRRLNMRSVFQNDLGKVKWVIRVQLRRLERPVDNGLLPTRSSTVGSDRLLYTISRTVAQIVSKGLLTITVITCSVVSPSNKEGKGFREGRNCLHVLSVYVCVSLSTFLSFYVFFLFSPQRRVANQGRNSQRLSFVSALRHWPGALANNVPIIRIG